jgi:hypothetical protein
MQSMNQNNVKRYTMKKSILSLFILMALCAAVNSYGQASFGIKGSFDMFNITIKNSSGNKVETSMIPKFDAGVFAEVPVADEFFIRPELLLATKGAKMKDVSVKTTYNLSYLELPILFLYKGALSDGKVLLGFGPYLAMGISGKLKEGSSSTKITFKNDIASSTSGAAVFKPMDIGAMLMAGYELAGGFSFALNTSMGLTNIIPKVNGVKPDASMTNVGFGLTLGYKFGKK